MPESPATTVRIDPQLKADAKKVFDELGISLSSAVSAFLKAVVREQGMPFDMHVRHVSGCEVRLSEGLRCSTDEPVKNRGLNAAGKNKRDEFYTLLADIEAELPHYSSSFKGKTVLCNCDNPFDSNFFKFLVAHFEDYGIKKLIATCYSGCAEGPFVGDCGANKAYKATVTRAQGLPSASRLSNSDLERLFEQKGNSLELLEGDGDFRSAECMGVLRESDIVVTNPPFSLFREFLMTLIEQGKSFLIIGNMNAATCKDIFPLFRDNRVHFGVSVRSGDRKFYVPDSYPLDASGCGVDDDGRRFIRVKGVRWFTDLKPDVEQGELPLSRVYNSHEYPMLENYNAINVSRVAHIPSNYSGIMGVPITFLDKYNPDQFEILMLANGNVRANVSADMLEMVGYRRMTGDKGGVGILNGKRLYARILIRNRSPRKASHD